MRITGIATASLLVCAPLLAGDQGFIITSAFTLDRGKPITMTNYLSADHARWSSSAGDLLVDARSGQMIAIDSDSKTYYVTTLEDLNAATAALKKQTKAAAGTLTVDEEGRHSRTTPATTASWIVTFGSMSQAGLPRHGCGALACAWLLHAATPTRCERCLRPSAHERRPPGDAGAVQEDERPSLSSKGTMSFMGQQATSSTEVTDIERAEIPASTWQVPAGYKKVENPMREAIGLKK
jgi:hypothetical protein